jgi:hypothetical protein
LASSAEAASNSISLLSLPLASIFAGLFILKTLTALGRIGLVSQLPDLSLHPVVGALKRLLLCIQLIGDVAIGQCVSASRWRKLLQNSDLSIAEVAAPAGFRDANRMGRTFRQITGRGPTGVTKTRRRRPVNFPELSYFRIGQSGA